MESWGLLWPRIARVCVMGALALISAWVRAGDAPALDAALERQVRDLALAGSAHAGAGISRVEVQVGTLDARLRLAPCERIEPYLPAGTRLWGRTRIGLRCTQGVSHWNVFLPVTVKVYGTALVAATPLAAGAVVGSADIARAEVDLAEDSSTAMIDAQLVIGRALARAVNTGQALRQSGLRPRQWFAAGDTVKLLAQGDGFSVAGEGQALTPGIEGQSVRVKTESGRVLTGMPVGERRVELLL